MIDAFTEQLITLKEACKLPVFCRNGKSPHVSAMYRWAQCGALSQNGNRVALETIKTPSGIKTSVQAVSRFIGLLNSDGNNQKPVSERQRAKLFTDSLAELKRLGVK